MYRLECDDALLNESIVVLAANQEGVRSPITSGCLVSDDDEQTISHRRERTVPIGRWATQRGFQLRKVYTPGGGASDAGTRRASAGTVQRVLVNRRRCCLGDGEAFDGAMAKRSALVGYRWRSDDH